MLYIHLFCTANLVQTLILSCLAQFLKHIVHYTMHKIIFLFMNVCYKIGFQVWGLLADFETIVCRSLISIRQLGILLNTSVQPNFLHGNLTFSSSTCMITSQKDTCCCDKSKYLYGGTRWHARHLYPLHLDTNKFID